MPSTAIKMAPVSHSYGRQLVIVLLIILVLLVVLACGFVVLTGITWKCFVTLGTKGCKTKEYHLCEWIEDNKTYARIQGITRTNSTLLVIESDHVYRIPMANLNNTTVQMPLYVIQSEHGKSFGSRIHWDAQPWYAHNQTTLPDEPNGANGGDVARYRKLNTSGTLKRFSLIPNHHEELREKQYIRVYDFLNVSMNDQVIFQEHDNKLLNDSMKSGLYAYRFTVIADGLSKRGYLFHFDRPENEAKRRVLISELYMETDGKLKLNLPQTGHYPPLLPSHYSYYLRAQSHNKEFVLISFGDEPSDNKDGFSDFFIHLPLGFLAGDTVYLFCEAQHMVYYFDYRPLDKQSKSRQPSGSFYVKIKSWPEFWLCNPNTHKKFEPPATMNDYMALASHYKPHFSEMGSGNSVPGNSSSSINWPYLIVALLVGIVLTSGFCLCLILRSRRRRKEELARKRRMAIAGGRGFKGTISKGKSHSVSSNKGSRTPSSAKRFGRSRPQHRTRATKKETSSSRSRGGTARPTRKSKQAKWSGTDAFSHTPTAPTNSGNASSESDSGSGDGQNTNKAP